MVSTLTESLATGAEAALPLPIESAVHVSVAGSKATMETSPSDRTAPASRAPTLRSRVTNGRSHFVEADGRGPWARRWRDVLAELLYELEPRGPDLLSEGQRQLARRIATLAIACERMDGEAASGREIDLDAYGALTDRLGRALQRLVSINKNRRRPKDAGGGLTLADLMREAAEAAP
jgi:hypothetical protein